MIPIKEEYQRMFEVEEQLWWYRILHRKVLLAIQNEFNSKKDIKILDACCGTGGLLSYLQKSHYESITGFDLSPEAVDFSRSRGLNIHQIDLRELQFFKPKEKFDVIVCNDAFYFLSDNDIKIAVESMLNLLNDGGLIVSNNHAFEVFSGTHDIAVGSNRRFVAKDFIRIFATLPAVLISGNYWSLLLSPLILMIRVSQKIGLRLKWINSKNIKSDVSLPNSFLNELFFKIVNFEEKFIKKSPFGSSYFWVLKKI